MWRSIARQGPENAIYELYLLRTIVDLVIDSQPLVLLAMSVGMHCMSPGPCEKLLWEESHAQNQTNGIEPRRFRRWFLLGLRPAMPRACRPG